MTQRAEPQKHKFDFFFFFFLFWPGCVLSQHNLRVKIPWIISKRSFGFCCYYCNRVHYITLHIHPSLLQPRLSGSSWVSAEFIFGHFSLWERGSRSHKQKPRHGLLLNRQLYRGHDDHKTTAQFSCTERVEMLQKWLWILTILSESSC